MLKKLVPTHAYKMFQLAYEYLNPGLNDFKKNKQHIYYGVGGLFVLVVLLSSIFSSPHIIDVIEIRNGIAYLPNDEKPFTGIYEPFDKIGLQIDYYDGLKKSETRNKDGKKNGLEISYYENGQKKFETNWVDDEKNGLEISYYEDGQKKYERNYVDGKRNGLLISYHQNGRKESETNYVDDKQNSLEIIYYDNGRKKYERNYVDGKINGLEISYDNNGRKESERNYSHLSRKPYTFEIAVTPD